MSERIIDIATYWPRVVGDTDEFKQIALAENPEFNLTQSCIYRLLKDGFIPDATEYGVERWEKMLDLPVTSDMTLDERKEQILKYLSIKLPYTIRVLRELIKGYVGEGNFEVRIDNDTQTLTIAYASVVTDSQREQVDSLVERVIPQNLVIEYDQGLPIDYTRLEFLEGTGTQRINTGIVKSGEYRAICEYAGADVMRYGNWFGWNYNVDNVTYRNLFIFFNTSYLGRFAHNSTKGYILPPNYNQQGYIGTARNRLESTEKPNQVVLNGNVTALYEYSPTAVSNENPKNQPVYLWFLNGVKIYAFSIFNDTAKDIEYIPALDPTGAPCMYDLVTKKPFYNSGTGDFLYPSAEQAVQTLDLDLDAKSYAKLTEHGIRRLYHVPKGYNGTKDEYAAANGFKELVEPPAPLEGNWEPQWRETETQLICEWVETMEVTEND